MVAAGRNVEHGVKRSRLTGRGKHCSRAALKLAYFSGYTVAGGVLQARIEISACFQIEKPAHILACIIFKGCALNYRYLPRLAVTRSVSALYANGISVHKNHPEMKNFISVYIQYTLNFVFVKAYQ